MKRIHLFLTLFLSLFASTSFASVTAKKVNLTTVEFQLDNGQRIVIDFYGPNIFRLFLDPMGDTVRDPVASPPAQILVNEPRRDPGAVGLEDHTDNYAITTSRLRLFIDKTTGLLAVEDLEKGRKVFTQLAPISFEERGQTQLTLSAQADEHFFGGGVQNGRFAHRGKIIAIENTNNWTDGGVASPTPFYWSSGGYGILWHTFRPGKYDFGATQEGEVRLMHETTYADFFVMVDNGPIALLNDFYQLTGHPVLLPKFGFYEGHLNAYNRDYWTLVGESTDKKMYGEAGSVAFEDGQLYKESQKPVDGGIRESLNGELEDNYQFSARAVVDRYEQADMPLGWVLPNDAYGAGYGQTETLEGNVDNLRLFGDYARAKGVEIGLWTQSDLHPKEGVEALLQRDIVREVRDAGVRVLKTDVAWVGAGYSFGLNGVADVGEIMPKYGNDARPFIISLDGWAGTQRYAGIWTGDQTGGEWEYIRFHIPTYIGSGLSGQPNISSDMDGIFGGRNMPVNVRDFQWKTFTPMQLNMDGWGSNPKYPQALGEPATSINRWYLKLKSMLMPYAYTIAHEAINGMPMIRPVGMSDEGRMTNDELRMTNDKPNSSFAIRNPSLQNSAAVQYEFLYGPDILVAPIYQNTAADEVGNDIRNNIYLPEGEWVDYFSGQCYEGGRIINGFAAPLWKLPVFVRRGAIIPMIHAHNNPNQIDRHTRAFVFYPKGYSEFTAYDDDGRTEAYRRGESATTRVTSNVNEKGVLTLTIEPTKGEFKGMERQQSTELVINLSERPKDIRVRINGKRVRMDEAQSLLDFTRNTNVFYYDEQPQMNLWASPNTDMEKLDVRHTPRLYVCIAETDITQSKLEMTMKAFSFDNSNLQLEQHGALTAPTLLTDDFQEGSISPSAYTLPLQWTAVNGADYYEIEHQGIIFSTITPTAFTIESLQPETRYEVQVRAVNADGAGPWAREVFMTSPDPLRHAIHGITAETTCENQPGQGTNRAFDFDEGSTWHTAWSKQAVPFDMVIDLHSVNILDELHYMPRPDGGNGTLARGTLYYSMDRQTWTEAGSFTWPTDGTTKKFAFQGQPQARYIKLHVDEARGGFGSGQQIFVFRVAGSEWYIPGDINHDNRIDENDFTSYMNYTGLRRGDGDYEGYISKGDLNQNGLIDAYDISTVGIELETGVSSRSVPPVAGSVSVTADKTQLNANDIVTLTVKGKGLQSVNAISFALPYDATQLEYVGIDATGTQEMRNLTYDRLHTNGQKALYPTFVNCGEHPYAEGDGVLMTIRFRAKQKTRVNLKAQDGMLVDKYLNVISW